MPPRILLAGLRFALFWFRFGFVTCNNVEPFWKAIQMLIPLQGVLQGLRQHPLLAGHLGFGFHSRSLGFGLCWRCRPGWSGLMKKIVNSQKDQKKGSLTLTLRKSQGGGKEDGTPHVKQGEDLFWALTTHNSPVTTFSIYYVLGQGSLFLRLSERSKAKALLVPCSPSISDIQVSQWIMRQYMGIPATASEARTCPDCRQCWRWNWEFQGGAPQATLGFTSGRLPASQFGERGECPTLAMTIITVNLFCSNSETLCFSEVFGVHRYNLLFWIGEKNVTKPP